MRSLFAVCCLTVLLWSSGCAPADSSSELHSLNGIVTRSSGPVTSGSLIFIPESSSPAGQVYNAQVREDGSFSAQTVFGEGDGAVIKPGIPAGRYRIVYHSPSDGSKSGLEVELFQRLTVEESGQNALLVLPDQRPEGDGRPRDDK